MKNKKVETIEEFLARGGKIQKIPPSPIEDNKAVTVKSTCNGPVVGLTLSEGRFYYGKTSAKKRKPIKKKEEPIDWSVVPKHIRDLFMNKE